MTAAAITMTTTETAIEMAACLLRVRSMPSAATVAAAAN
jgi:hypothetical protein